MQKIENRTHHCHKPLSFILELCRPVIWRPVASLAVVVRPPPRVVASSADYEYLMFLGARRSCGQFNSILFNSIQFYSILFYSILFYSIQLYSILFYSILFYSILFYSILFYSILSLECILRMYSNEKDCFFLISQLWETLLMSKRTFLVNSDL